ncbi:MAG: DNA polymerase III subunit beta [Desulfobacteraceae bacterium]|nr:DNA polymerase III subunit beta [Desulfobacteraceae bacterium]
MSMIVNLSREELLAKLASLQNVTGKKGTIAILSNVLIEARNEAVEITGTDLEVGIRNRVQAEVRAEGAITLPSKKLFEIVRESDAAQLSMEVRDNNWVRIKAGSSDYNLAGMPAEEYPSFPEHDEGALVPLPGELLKDLIDKTFFSIAQEGESQFNLTGVLVQGEQKDGGSNVLKMISSDGHRLSLMEREIDSPLAVIREKGVIIPRKGVQEIRKFAEGNEILQVGFEEKQAVIKSGESLMVIRLMNGDFPDYKGILNGIGRERRLSIERAPFLNSMKRMNLFTEDRYNAVTFKIDRERLVLSSQSMDIGNAKDELPAKYDGDPIELGFNGRYFVEVLQVLASTTVQIAINSEESPCLVQAEEDPGFLSVIMPMKL